MIRKPKTTTTTTVPLSSLLPPSLNPTNKAILHLTTQIKQNITQIHLPTHLHPHLSSHSISAILLRCQSHPLPSLRFFTYLSKSNLFHPQLTPQHYSVLAHILTWASLFRQTKKTLLELAQNHPQTDVFKALVSAREGCNWRPEVFGVALKVFVEMGRMDDGLDFFRKMVSAGFRPSVVECNCLLNGLLKVKECSDACWGMYEEMQRIGVSPNRHTFNILTNLVCKGGGNGGAQKAKEFVEELGSKGFEPDVITYNTLITGYCRKGKMDDAFYLYKIMYRRGVLPDLVTYTILVNGLCRGGRVKEAHQLFHQMLHRGVDADGFMFNVLIVGYCNESKMTEARSVLQDMIDAGFLPDRLTCYVLVEEYRKGGKLLNCLNLLTQLRGSGVLISFEIYRNLISSLCQEGRPNAARNLLGLLLEDGYAPNLEVYNFLLTGFSGSGFVLEAVELKDEMIERGIKLNVASYRILVGCLCRIGRSADAECLMWEMVASDLMPDSELCVSLIKGYSNEGMYLKAELLLHSVSENLQIREIKCYNALIDAYCKDGNFSKAFQVQDKMLKLGILPNNETCKFLIYGLSKTKECE